MATATAASPARGEAIREREKLFNFLKKYDFQNYYTKFVQSGVHKLSHLKNAVGDENSLSEIGLTNCEKARLKTKVKENLAWRGRMVKRITGRNNQFDGPAPEVSCMTVVKEGRRAAAIIPKDQIKKIRQIGEGAHGAVFEGTWADEHGAVAVAIKMLYKKQENQEQFIKEADSMSSLNHKHIIQLYGIVLSSPLMLVEELAPFGSLLEYVKKEGSKSSLKLLYTYALQVADAMAYLESRRIVHRDLAIRNILLAHVDLIKLSDFGMARALDESSDVYKLSNMTAKIPVAWTPLEALTHAMFSTASDVWSFGVSVWEVYSLGKVPWQGLGPVQIMDTLSAGDRLGRPERCPTDVFELVAECWAGSPKDRPTFADIYRRLKLLPPKQVRATKSYSHSDQDHLTAKNGELIFVIDRPNSGWLYGMKSNGTCGLMSTDHISDIVNPLDDIKAKVTAGAMTVSDICIGSPTEVELMVHIRRDGSKWVSENAQESEVKWTPPSTPTLLQTRVLDVRSPSPGQNIPTSPLTDSHASLSREPHLRAESYRSPVSMATPRESSDNDQEDYRDGPFDDNLDFIMDTGNDDDDLIGLDRFSGGDARTLTVDDQYVSMRRTLDPDVISPTHRVALQENAPSSTDVAEPYPTPQAIQSDQVQGSSSSKTVCSPYVSMQSCSARNLQGMMENKAEVLTTSFSPTSSSSIKPMVKKRSLTVASPLPPPPPQPAPRTRLRNYTTVSSDYTEPLAAKKVAPTVPPRLNYVAVVTESKKGSPSISPRRPPLPKTGGSGSLAQKETATPLPESDNQESEDAVTSSSSPPPPLPPTPRIRMRDGYDGEHSQSLSDSAASSPRRNSTGPLSSMFNASFVHNMVGENGPAYTRREKPRVGDRSSAEGIDGASSLAVTSPAMSTGVPSHYDVPRSWTSGRPQEQDLLTDTGSGVSSNPLLLPPLNPAPTPPLRKSRRHSAISLTTSSSSSSPASPSKAEKGWSCSIQEHPDQDEPVIPRRIRLLSSSPSASPNRICSTTVPDASVTNQGFLAVNPRYGEFGNKSLKDSLSTPEVSPDLGTRYATIPRDHSSINSTMSQYTVLSPVKTNPKPGKSSTSSTLTYQPIQIHSVDKLNDYQSIDDFAGYSTISSVTTGMKEGKSSEAIGYQSIMHDTRVKHEDYTMLDPKNRILIKSPVPSPVPFEAPRPKTAAATPEDCKIDIDKGRKELKLKVILADEEFSECDPEILKFALSHENYDVEHTKHYIRVQHLLSMLLPNITEDDCSKALLHCQQKVDRAALWLMEKSHEIEQGAH